MDSKDYIIDKLAKEKAQLEVHNSELEFAIMLLQQENEKLKKELEEANDDTSKNKPKTPTKKKPTEVKE